MAPQFQRKANEELPKLSMCWATLEGDQPRAPTFQTRWKISTTRSQSERRPCCTAWTEMGSGNSWLSHFSLGSCGESHDRICWKSPDRDLSDPLRFHYELEINRFVRHTKLSAVGFCSSLPKWIASSPHIISLFWNPIPIPRKRGKWTPLPLPHFFSLAVLLRVRSLIRCNFLH